MIVSNIESDLNNNKKHHIGKTNVFRRLQANLVAKYKAQSKLVYMYVLRKRKRYFWALFHRELCKELGNIWNRKQEKADMFMIKRSVKY